VNYLSENRRPL